jgi:hypothetical protein
MQARWPTIWPGLGAGAHAVGESKRLPRDETTSKGRELIGRPRLIIAKQDGPTEPVKQTAASADGADEARCAAGTGLLNTAVWALVVPSLGVVRPGAGTPASVESHPETLEGASKSAHCHPQMEATEQLESVEFVQVD